MGYYKFRLSDMMPNAWFYKLKDMSKSSSSNKNKGHSRTNSSSSTSSYSLSTLQPDNKRQPHNLAYQRKSYYISRNLSPVETLISQNPVSDSPKTSDNVVHVYEQPRKSSKKRRSTTRIKKSPKLVSSSVSASCSCRASIESVWTKPDSTPEEYPNSPVSSSSSSEHVSISAEKLDPMSSISPSCGCKIDDMKKETLNLDHGFQYVPKIDLPPIITNPEKFDEKQRIIKEKQRIVQEKQGIVQEKQSIVQEKQGIVEKQRISSVRRVSVSSSTGVKLRTNSPRITTNSRKIQGRRKSVSSRRSSTVSESFAVVKSSRNPQKDFRESMVEMIMENNIRASRDLEQLLACYLSLNSDEYHDLIIKVFKQIWFEMTDIRLN